MEERKLKRKNKTIKILVLLIIFIPIFQLFGLDNKIMFTTKIVKDSLEIKIVNNTIDTIYISLYEQRKYNSKWTTSNYDIFCDISNPSRRALKVLPNEKIILINKKNTFPYFSEGGNTYEEFDKLSVGKRRIKLLILNHKDIRSKIKPFYISNTY